MNQSLGSYRTVKRVLDVLRLFGNSEQGFRVSDISKELDIPLSSAQVLLRELEKYDFLRVGDGKRYITGPALLSLSVRVSSNVGLTQVARPHMRQLADLHGEDVYLALPQHDSIMYVDCVAATGIRYRLDIPLGLPRPLHASAAGQLYLASQSPEHYEELVEGQGLPRLTARTTTDRMELDAKIEVVRRRGYAVSREEAIDGVIGIAAPIRDRHGQLAGVLTLSMLLARLREDGSEERLATALVKTSCKISRDLGWTGSTAGVPREDFDALLDSV